MKTIQDQITTAHRKAEEAYIARIKAEIIDSLIDRMRGLKFSEAEAAKLVNFIRSRVRA